MNATRALACASAILVLAATRAPAAPPEIHIIWMGGNDCPPCRAWRAAELPKLQQSPEFAGVKFSYVEKVIGSTVPPRIFLPAEVKPYQEKLEAASNDTSGSPQCAILVNGQVYDYFHSARSAESFERMLRAIRTGGKYPFKRCLKFKPHSRSKCEVPA